MEKLIAYCAIVGIVLIGSCLLGSKNGIIVALQLFLNLFCYIAAFGVVILSWIYLDSYAPSDSRGYMIFMTIAIIITLFGGIPLILALFRKLGLLMDIRDREKLLMEKEKRKQAKMR